MITFALVLITIATILGSLIANRLSLSIDEQTVGEFDRFCRESVTN